jgi:GGDEF domain-containing protein
MEFKRFEKLLLLVGAGIIIVSVGTAFTGGTPDLIEIVAQLLLFGVLFAAVKYGRRGGLVAAILASTGYVLLRIETVSASEPSLVALYLIASRLLAFGLIGVAGGEICGRIKYTLASLEGGTALDEWSRVFNGRWAYKTLVQARARSRRYGEPFSVVLVSVSPSVMADIRPSKQRALIRIAAEQIRSDIRMVDEVARLDDGRFVVVMPHTPADGGRVVMERLRIAVQRALAVRDESVRVECFGLPGDDAKMDALIETMSPVPVPAEEPRVLVPTGSEAGL